MTDWIVDPINNVELRLDYLKSIMPVSAANVIKYTSGDSNIPMVSLGEPLPFQFQLSAEILANSEDTKRKVSYFDKQQAAVLMILGSRQEAMYGFLEHSDFSQNARRQNIMTLNMNFVGKGFIIGHMREAENTTLGASVGSSADALASNGYMVDLDGQDEYLEFSITQSIWALPLGNYRLYCRVRDSSQVASDLTISVYNTTDSASIATADKTCTASYAWYSLDFVIASGQSGDAIRFRALKKNATANAIHVDMLAVVMV